MPLKDPVAAYHAADNVEAESVRDALLAAGIAAHFTQDLASVDVFAFGPAPEVHGPRVWIERSDAEKAGPILAEFERRAAESRGTESAREKKTAAPIEQACEECGGALSFPAEQDGSVQECKHCGALVDVGEVGADEDWGTAEESGAAE